MINEEQINVELNSRLCRKEEVIKENKIFTRCHHVFMSDVLKYIQELPIDDKISYIRNIIKMWNCEFPLLNWQNLSLKIYVLNIIDPGVLNSKKEAWSQ